MGVEPPTAVACKPAEFAGPPAAGWLAAVATAATSGLAAMALVCWPPQQLCRGASTTPCVSCYCMPALLAMVWLSLSSVDVVNNL